MPNSLIFSEMSENWKNAEIPSNTGSDFESLVKESIVKESFANVDSSENEDIKFRKKEVSDQLAEQEADLNAHLESMKPKPKRLSLAERLKQMPGYENLCNLKPKIGQGAHKNSKEMIDLSKGSKPASLRKSSGIQTLVDRFIHHTNVIKPAKEHFKTHVSKKAEDSQGQEHVTVDEVDYIKITNSDDEEKMGSPSQVPGSKMIRVQEQLKRKIYAQKAKEFAEKMKLHAMYAEEKELEDKNTHYDPLPNEEEEFEEMSESEIDEDEEEELEELLSGTPKERRRKRLVYVDDQAENSDDGVDADDEDQDDESSYDENDDDDLPSVHNDNCQNFVDDDFDHFDIGFPISDTLPSAQPRMDKQDLTEAASRSPVKINIEELDVKSTPSDLCLRPPAPRCPIGVSVEIYKLEETSDSAVTNQISEIEEETSQENSSASECKSPMPSVVADLVERIGDSLFRSSEDILALCSGTFPSHQPATPEESQNCFGFHDDKDNIILAKLDESENKVIVATPKPADNFCKSVLENDTPKLSEKVSTTKRLFFGETNSNEANATLKFSDDISKSRLFSFGSPEGVLENYDSEDNESLVGVRVVSKRKRLEFSDEEEDEKSYESEINDDVGYDDEEMAMEVKERKVIPRKSLFGKDGRLRKQFIEAEAELSGSAEGSEDEDERGLDKMEIEEGDEEIIDEDDVREKVGRAHLKALLDQDDEEIQYIQNELLQDGDLHMENGRERNFKWNYMTYEMDDNGANMGDFGEETPMDEAEVKRQIEKAEKSKWIKENSQLFEEGQQESQKSLLENSGFLKLSKASLKKFTSLSESSSFHGNDVGDTSITFTSFTRLLTGQVKNIITTNASEKKSAEDPLCKATSQPLFASPDEPISKLRRGSFLSRGAPTLSRLADMTKIGDSFSNIRSNSKNFVFSVVTPPEAEDSKSKKTTFRRNQSLKVNPKKMLKIDRSFSSLDDSSKDASIFKWI